MEKMNIRLVNKNESFNVYGYSEFTRIESLRSLIPQSNFLIYKNVILKESRSFHYYKINSEDEIWYGKLEDYLVNDDFIIEIIIMGSFFDQIEFVCRHHVTVSMIKSELERFLYLGNNIITYDSLGSKLSDEDVIYQVSSAWRIIISCSNDTYDDCCNFYNIGVLNTSYWFFRRLPWKLGQFNDETGKLSRIIKHIQTVVLFDKQGDETIGEIYSRMPPGLMGFGGLFIRYLVRTLWFSQYRELIESELHDYGDIRDSLHATLFLSVLHFFARNIAMYPYQFERIHLEMLMSKIKKDDYEIRYFWNEVCEYFINPPYDIRDIYKLVLRAFQLGPKPYDQTISSYLDHHVNYCIVPKQKIRSNGIIPMGETVLELRKSIADSSGVDVKGIKLFRLGGDHILKDEEICDVFERLCIIKPSLQVDDKEIKGSGASGTVSLYSDLESKEQRALKEMDVSCDRRIISTNQLLNREFSVYSKLTGPFHGFPYIVNVFDLYSKEGLFQISMEYIENGSLGSFLRRHRAPLPVHHIRRVSKNILLALEYIHKRQIVHRDIKGDNILIDEQFNAKLCDFGHAVDLTWLSSARMLENRKNYVLGTYYYMAPEMINGEVYSEKIDIWSFGVTVIEMIHGQAPYAHMAPQVAFVKIAKSRKIVYQFPDNIPKSLIDFVELCLKSNPEERPSARNLLKSEFICEEIT